MITRAIDRGEAPATTDPHLVLEALVGPLQFRSRETYASAASNSP
jgi:hypothetical protein